MLDAIRYVRLLLNHELVSRMNLCLVSVLPGRLLSKIVLRLEIFLRFS